MMLFGNRRFALTILIAMTISVAAQWLSPALAAIHFEWAGIGFIVPGLLAHQFDRQGVVPTLAMLTLAAGQPAQAADGWQQPTAASFWSNAASAATATTYAPTSPTLHRAKVGKLDALQVSLPEGGKSAMVATSAGQTYNGFCRSKSTFQASTDCL